MVTATKYLYRIDFVIRWKIVDNIVWLCLEYQTIVITLFTMIPLMDWTWSEFDSEIIWCFQSEVWMERNMQILSNIDERRRPNTAWNSIWYLKGKKIQYRYGDISSGFLLSSFFSDTLIRMWTWNEDLKYLIRFELYEIVRTGDHQVSWCCMVVMETLSWTLLVTTGHSYSVASFQLVSPVSASWSLMRWN